MSYADFQRQGMFSYQPTQQDQDNAYASQLQRYAASPDGQREQFERGMMQQEQDRRASETNQKYGVLGGLLGGMGGTYTAKGWYGGNMARRKF